MLGVRGCSVRRELVFGNPDRRAASKSVVRGYQGHSSQSRVVGPDSSAKGGRKDETEQIVALNSEDTIRAGIQWLRPNPRKTSEHVMGKMPTDLSYKAQHRPGGPAAKGN